MVVKCRKRPPLGACAPRAYHHVRLTGRIADDHFFIETAWADYHAAAGSWEAWVDAKLAEERERILSIMTEVVASLQRDFAQTVLEVRAASRPADGRDGRSLKVRGTWDPGASYFTLDVVALDGASFVAKRDNPGVCPGEFWQMLSRQGKKGPPGPQGD
jgi:hypothetical protein